MYKGIIFDFFGVMRTDGYLAWLNKHGYKRTGEYDEVSKLADHDYITMEEFFTRLSEISGMPLSTIETEFDSQVSFNTELVKIIEKLKKSYKIGLLSNSNGKHLRDILKTENMESLFDFIVISGEVNHIKPEEEVFEIALNGLSLMPTETIFIDDNPNYIEAAISYKLKGLLYKDNASLIASLKELGIIL